MQSINQTGNEGSPSIDKTAMYTLTYGLFVLSARSGERDNACIVNTVTQIADRPLTIAVSVNKANHTHDMIKESMAFNVSVLTEDTPFSLFEHFGFQSGRDTDKFAGYAEKERAQNGIFYLTKHCSAVLCARVQSVIDCGSHSLFIAALEEAKVLSKAPSLSYAYYHAHVKPKPKPREEKKKGFICKICGFVYEGDELPPDYICPICKHGAEDFEPLS